MAYSFGDREYEGGRSNFGQYVLGGRGLWPLAERLVLGVNTYTDYDTLNSDRQYFSEVCLKPFRLKIIRTMQIALIVKLTISNSQRFRTF